MATQGLDAERLARLESHPHAWPGGAAYCERLRAGGNPWPAIAFATAFCTGFPTDEFNALASTGDFDVRWPLTFTAWYWCASGASVDRACAGFLTASRLWERAAEALPEYAETDALAAWRTRFEQTRRRTLS